MAEVVPDLSDASDRTRTDIASAGSARTDLAATFAPEGIYLHVPFCVSVCPYCDFVVVAGSAARGPGNRVGSLVEAMHVELDLRADALETQQPAGRPGLVSLYIGGGTPSLLSAVMVAGLVEHVDRRFGLLSDAEVTLEANPGPDEIGDLQGFRAAGVNRLSIGAQSMRAEELRELGRRHTPADVGVAVAAARTAGFDDVSLDLLTDVPGQDEATWHASLSSALALQPDHLSIYSLSLGDPDGEGLTGTNGDHLPVSRGARRWRERARPRQSQDLSRQLDTITDTMTADAGFERYEIANLARRGRRSRHNLLYWRRRPYLGFGPGAHSSDGARSRSWNAARLDAYVAALDGIGDGGRVLPPGGSELIDADTSAAEAVMLQLRLSEGVSADAAHGPVVSAGVTWALDNGLARTVGERVVLTDEGRALANEVFMRLLPSARGGMAT